MIPDEYVQTPVPVKVSSSYDLLVVRLDFNGRIVIPNIFFKKKIELFSINSFKSVGTYFVVRSGGN